MRLQPFRCGVEWFSRLTIKVFLAFYITSRANVDGGPFNDLKTHPSRAVVLVTTWQYTDGQNHCCHRAAPSQCSS
jgi:hypothetical protein